MSRLFAAVCVSIFAVLGACQTTTVTTVWKTPDPLPAEPFHKVVALVLNTTPAERRAAEDRLASEISGGRGVPAYTLIPDDDLKDRERVRGILEKAGIDGAVVLRLVSREKQTEYHPPSYTPSSSFYGYQSYDLYPPMYQQGYTTTTVVIQAEVSVYAVRDERLLWAGSSETTDPANIQDLVSQVAAATVAELKKQGILKAE